MYRESPVVFLCHRKDVMEALEKLLENGFSAENLNLKDLLQEALECLVGSDVERHLQVMGKVALLSGTLPYSYAWGRGLVHPENVKQRLLLEAALLQGIIDAHPFTEEHFQETLRVFSGPFDADTRVRIFSRLFPWGWNHQREVFLDWLPTIACPPQAEWKHAEELQWYLNRWLLLECTDVRYLQYLKSFLRHPHCKTREKAARHLNRLGWKPRGRSETAAHVVATRNLKAVRHLQDKMKVALGAIYFPSQGHSGYFMSNHYWEPDIRYYLEVGAQLPDLMDPEKLDLIVKHSKSHHNMSMAVQLQFKNPPGG